MPKSQFKSAESVILKTARPGVDHPAREVCVDGDKLMRVYSLRHAGLYRTLYAREAAHVHVHQ